MNLFERVQDLLSKLKKFGGDFALVACFVGTLTLGVSRGGRGSVCGVVGF